MKKEDIKKGDIIKIEFGFGISTFKVLDREGNSLLLKHVWFFGLLPGYIGKIVKSLYSPSFDNFELLNK